MLGPELADFACKVWGVTEHGNFEGHNILFRARSDEEDAKELGLSVKEFRAKLAEVEAETLSRRDPSASGRAATRRS